MLSYQERKNFRIAIILNDITMRDWCVERGYSYNSFRSGFNGHQKMTATSEDAVRKYIKDNNMETDPIMEGKDDREEFAKKRQEAFNRKVLEALELLKNQRKKKNKE